MTLPEPLARLIAQYRSVRHTVLSHERIVVIVRHRQHLRPPQLGIGYQITGQCSPCASVLIRAHGSPVDRQLRRLYQDRHRTASVTYTADALPPIDIGHIEMPQIPCPEIAVLPHHNTSGDVILVYDRLTSGDLLRKHVTPLIVCVYVCVLIE